MTTSPLDWRRLAAAAGFWLLAAGLGGCPPAPSAPSSEASGSTPAPPSPTPPRPLGETSTAPTSSGTPASAPETPAAAPEAAPRGEPEAKAPWTLDRRGFEPPRVPDGLVFWGWSADDRRFAFEVYSDGRGTRCSGRRWLRVVDATADRFLEREDLAHPDPDEDDCRTDDLERRMRPRRERALAAHGVVVGRLLPPALIEPVEPGRFRFSWPSGRSGWLRFEERFVIEDVYAESDGAAYRLALERPGRSPLVIEPGTRRRRSVIGYRLTPGWVFAAPSGPAFAVLLIRMDRDFEGARWSWMANGALRPQDMVGPR